MAVIAAEVLQYQLHPMLEDEVSAEPIARYLRDDGIAGRFRLERLDSSETYSAALVRLADEWFHQYRQAQGGTIYRTYAVGVEENKDEQYLICTSDGQEPTDQNRWCFSGPEFERLTRLQL